MTRAGLCVALLFAAAATAETVAAVPATPVLSVGIVPQQTPTRLVRLWVPFLDEVGRRSGYRLDFKTGPDIPTFHQRALAGEYDLIYIDPYQYTKFHRASGYEAFAREEGYLQGVIVVHRDSPLRSLADLRGKIVAFPAPTAFASTVLPLAALREQGIVVTPQYVTSHESVYLAVARGLYAAGGGIHRTLEQAPPEVNGELRVLWSSGSYTTHAIAAHPRVTRQAIQRLQRALVELKRDPQGRALLQALGFTGIAAASDREWDDVRALPSGRFAATHVGAGP